MYRECHDTEPYAYLREPTLRDMREFDESGRNHWTLLQSVCVMVDGKELGKVSANESLGLIVAMSEAIMLPLASGTPPVPLTRL